VAASTRPREKLSATPIFSRNGRRVIVTGQLPPASRPVAIASLWIFPPGEAA
jgi:hypothetical protein